MPQVTKEFHRVHQILLPKRHKIDFARPRRQVAVGGPLRPSDVRDEGSPTDQPVRASWLRCADAVLDPFWAVNRDGDDRPAVAAVASAAARSTHSAEDLCCIGWSGRGQSRGGDVVLNFNIQEVHLYVRGATHQGGCCRKARTEVRLI